MYTLSSFSRSELYVQAAHNAAFGYCPFEKALPQEVVEALHAAEERLATVDDPWQAGEDYGASVNAAWRLETKPPISPMIGDVLTGYYTSEWETELEIIPKIEVKPKVFILDISGKELCRREDGKIVKKTIHRKE